MNEVKAMKKADDFNNRQEEIDILMSCPDALSGRQLTRMLYVEGFGAAGLTYPAVAAAADTGGRGGLAFVFYGAFLLVYAGWLVCSSWKKALPPWAAGIYIIRFLVNAAALIFFFGCSIRNIYMPDHSLFWLLIPFVVLLWYCTETNLQKHARFVELLFPWIAFLFALLILAASAGLLFKIGGTAGGIAPAGTSAGLPGGIRGGYGLLLCSSSLEFICFLLPSCIMPEKRAVKPGLNIEASGERIKADKSNGFLFKRYVLKGILGGYLCNFLLWFVTVQSLGRAVTASTYWPVVKVMQLISLPGGFLERFDILLVVYWILCMIGVLSGYLYYARRLAEDTFFARWPDHVKKKRMAAFTGIILFCIYVIACLLPDLDRTISIYGWYKAWIDLPLILLLPFLIGRRKKLMDNKTAKKKIRNWIFLLLLLFLFTLPAGCRKQTDAEKKRYILSLYIERQEEEYRFRLSEADLTGDMEKEASIPCKVIERIDGSLKELEKNERNREAGQLEWNHIYTIFIGPKLAACPERLLSFLGEWDGAWQKSPNVSICLVQSSAASIFEDELEDAGEEESRIGQKAAQLMEQAEKKGGVCRTPIDILKAYDDGSRRLRLYCLLLDEKTKEIRINPGILSFQEP